MEQKFARVLDSTGEPIQWLYVRIYGTPPVRRYYCVFTDWQHIRRCIPLGKSLTFQRAIKKVGDIEKKNINELDWDGARVRGMMFTKWADECKSIFKSRDFSLLPHLESVFGSMALSKMTDKEILDYPKIRAGQGVNRRGKERTRKISQTTINKELGFSPKAFAVGAQYGAASAPAEVRNGA